MGDKVAKLQAWCYATLLALVRRTQHRNDSDPEDDHSEVVVQQQHCDATEEAMAGGACSVVTADEEEAFYDFTKTIETDAGFLELWDLDGPIRRLVSVDAVTAWMGCTVESTKEGIYIPTHADFQLLVEAYNYGIAQQPTQNNQTTNEGVYFDASVETYNPNAFHVEVEVQQIPNKGRGIVTTQDIPKGTRIWTPQNKAEFPNTDVVRDFFLYLFKPYHRNRKRKLLSSIACDLFRFWGYTVQTTQNPYGDYLLCLDLDHASLMNQPGDYWYEEEETAASIADEEEEDEEEEEDYDEEDYDETEVVTAGDKGDDGSHNGTTKVTTVLRKPQVANAGQLTQERNDTGILYALRDIQAGEGTSMFRTHVMCTCVPRTLYRTVCSELLDATV